MAERHVVDYEGVEAVLVSLDHEQATLKLNNEQQITVPRTTLSEAEDGSYRVAFSLSRYQQDGVMVIPVTEETIHADKRDVVHNVRVTKTVGSQDVVVDQPLQRDDVDVERVMINRYVEEAPPIRHEGDTTIVPLVEEVLVVEKRLLLREEIRITRQHKVMHDPQTYTLRREDVQVERDDDRSEG